MDSRKKVAISGGFDPLHVGHVRLMKEARVLGDYLVVVVNNDNWLRLKKGFVFMPEQERVEIIRSFPFVDEVVLTDHEPDDTDMSVSRTLRRVRPAIFANGGDRTKQNVPEDAVCEECGIEQRYGVGGGKIQSSSWMIKDSLKPMARSVRPWGEFYGWDNGSGWYLKTIYIKPGKRLSLQYHTKRSECWLLVEGDATATIRDEKGQPAQHPLSLGELFVVPKGSAHRLESKSGGIIVEIALGEFDEGDIVRLQDDHGRA